MDEVVVYDALNSGAYFVDGTLGIIVLVAAAIAIFAGIVLLGLGLRRARGQRAAAGCVLMLAGMGAIAALELGPIRDGRDVAAGRYALSTGTVLVVSPSAVSVDKAEYATPCRGPNGNTCVGAVVGDQVRVAYRADDVTDQGPRALRVWRLPPPPPDPVSGPVSEQDEPDNSVYAPPEVARAPAATPTTRSSGGLTIRLIPGRLGQ